MFLKKGIALDLSIYLSIIIEGKNGSEYAPDYITESCIENVKQRCFFIQ